MKNDRFNLKINMNKYRNENLLNRVVIPFTCRSLHTVSEQLNTDSEMQALFDERYLIELM